MSARRDLEGAWAELTGMCAKALGRPARANPYPRQSAARRRWSAGHRFYQPNVSLGMAVSSLHVKQPMPGAALVKQPGPGRGHARLGPRREWTAIEDSVLLTYWGGEPGDRTAARLPGRNNQACRVRIHRLRRAADAEAPPCSLAAGRAQRPAALFSRGER